MKIIAETPRLILREMLDEDAEGMFELDSNPEVLKYIGTPALTHIDQSREVIRYIQQQYVDFGVGRVAVILKENNTFLGWSGLKYMTETINNQTGYHDLGYRYIQRYWGKGYATEAAIASRDYAFNVLKLDRICALIEPENIASQRVLEKTGLQFGNTCIAYGKSTDWYEMSNPNKT